MHSRSRPRWGFALVAGLVIVALSGCGTVEAPGRAPSRGVSVTVGSGGTAENEILAQLYGQALANEGYDVDYNPGVGDRKRRLAALKTGFVDLVPEYSGALMNHLDRSSTLTSTSSMVARIPPLLKSRKLQLLEPSRAARNSAFVVTKDFSQKHNIVTMNDLARVKEPIAIGAEPGFEELDYGRATLEAVYGVVGYKFKPVRGESGAALVKALLNDSVQVASIPISSSAILSKKLVVLGDPAPIVEEQNVVPIIRQAIYSEDFEEIVNSVSDELTTTDLREFNALVSKDDRPTAETIAFDWLVENGFIETLSSR